MAESIPFMAPMTLQERINLSNSYEQILAENKLLKEEIAELRKLIPSEIDKLEDIKSYVREVNSRRRSSRPPI